MIDAVNSALVVLIVWQKREHGFGRRDALVLMGQVDYPIVGNVVDPYYTIVAKFPKRFLPD